MYRKNSPLIQIRVYRTVMQRTFLKKSPLHFQKTSKKDLQKSKKAKGTVLKHRGTYGATRR